MEYLKEVDVECRVSAAPQVQHHARQTRGHELKPKEYGCQNEDAAAEENEEDEVGGLVTEGLALEHAGVAVEDAEVEDGVY